MNSILAEEGTPSLQYIIMITSRTLKKSFLTLIAIVILTIPLSARKENKLDLRMRRMVLDFESIMIDSQSRIPTALLRDAQGIIILRQFKVGLVVGVKAGGGIAMVRDKKTGKWSAPSFMKAGEGSWGLQIGAQGVVHIFLLMNKEGMRVLTSPKFRIGVDAAATAGPADTGVEAKIGVGSPIYVYSNSSGLYAGATFEGGFLLPNNKSNAEYYRNSSLMMGDILFDNKVEVPESAKPLIVTIEKYAKK